MTVLLYDARGNEIYSSELEREVESNYFGVQREMNKLLFGMVPTGTVLGPKGEVVVKGGFGDDCKGLSAWLPEREGEHYAPWVAPEVDAEGEKTDRINGTTHLPRPVRCGCGGDVAPAKELVLQGLPTAQRKGKKF